MSTDGLDLRGCKFTKCAEVKRLLDGRVAAMAKLSSLMKKRSPIYATLAS